MQPLVSVLGTDLGLTSKEIADIIWLALQMQTEDEMTPTATPSVPTITPTEETRSSSTRTDDAFWESSREQPQRSEPTPSAELHAQQPSQSSGFGKFLALNVPDARALREPLTLARALKPLLQQVVTGWSNTLDEAATVERIVDEQLWLPVLKPAREPWLELALVVDTSLSMQIWQRTISELQRLLSHYGVFRDVRVWAMATEAGEVRLYPGLGESARRQTGRRPSELIDPSGRRLILLATDCVSSAWQDGSLLPTLRLWATTGPVALVQMLPEWLWSRTGLGYASAVRLQSLLPGLPNQQLQATDLAAWEEIDLDAGIKLPVVTLEPEPFAAWTAMVMGKGGTWSPGFVFEPVPHPPAPSPQGEGEISPSPQREELRMRAEQRVQQFRVTASPMARRLAGLLAAAPVISLPVVRIIQDQLLPDSRQVHVAEVFLGGLLKPLGEPEPTNPDAVQYDFLEGVREILLESVPTSDTVDVVQEVSEFVAKRLNLSLDAFAALLRNPTQAENQELASQTRPFAMVTAQILRQLGGQYSYLAEELDQSLIASISENHRTQAELLEVITRAMVDGATELNLSNFGLSLPSEIFQLTNLQVLNLDGNRITEIPTEIAQLTNLTQLSLSSNQISVIPDEIAQLTNLIHLSLSRNQLSEIPPAIGQLTNLTVLDLSDNQLSEIPPAIGQLTNLTELFLSNNQLCEITPAIGQLTNLTVLDLSANQLCQIPDEIGQLSQLEKLDLRGNPLGIPPEILAPPNVASYETPPAQPILDYYFRTQDPTTTTNLFEAKILIVGEGGAGKTSLANKLLQPDYALRPETEDTSTQGIDILRWEFTGRNQQTYQVKIWDFGGQEIYHQTHQFFLTERSLYLLVADNRKKDTDHYFWLQIIRLLSDNSPVLLIQNEKQDRTCTLNLRELRAEFDNLRPPLSTNLATNRGLDAVRTQVQQSIEDLLPTGIPFPNPWLKVRYALENNVRNYITWSDYEAICRQHGISQRDEMFQLSGFLHSLGICLHFQRDPILRQCLILKPNWGNAAIYKILDNQRVRGNLGQFSDADLNDIWRGSTYAHLHHELLQLMKQFKVCYEIPRRPGNYIAPHLLSPDQPNYDWHDQQSLILRYRYKGIMPKGILTRFIVEMHREIENVSDPDHALVWKTGVVLTNGRSRAEVIERYYDKEIHLRLSGSLQRDYLTILHHQFEEIHDSYDRLDYDTLIPCNCSPCKSSPHPELYPLKTLQNFIAKGLRTIQCRNSYDDVNVRGLLSDSLDPYDDERLRRDKSDEGRIEYHIHGDLIWGDKQMAAQELPHESSSVSQPAFSSQPLTSERQRLETQRIHLQAEWQTRTEKLAQLRLASAIETGASRKFRLEQEMQTEEAEITLIERRLNNLEQSLANNSGSSTMSDIP